MNTYTEDCTGSNSICNLETRQTKTEYCNLIQSAILECNIEHKQRTFNATATISA